MIKKIKINLGCGRKYLEGYINCDYSNIIKKDKYIDLDKFPYPFKENFADEILLDNVLEHLDNVVGFMEEAHRILKKSGRLRIYVPYGKSDWAMQDPTHKHFFTERSMDYFEKEHDIDFYSNIKFEILENRLFCKTNTFVSKLRNLIPFKSILKYYLYNIYDGVYFEMKKI